MALEYRNPFNTYPGDPLLLARQHRAAAASDPKHRPRQCKAAVSILRLVEPFGLLPSLDHGELEA
jgi:hypothetical protein